MIWSAGARSLRSHSLGTKCVSFTPYSDRPFTGVPIMRGEKAKRDSRNLEETMLPVKAEVEKASTYQFYRLMNEHDTRKKCMSSM